MSKSNGFVERLRNILSFSSGNNDNQNTGYKRRSEDKSPEYAILTKYRKIDTAFPKVISRPFEGKKLNFGMRPFKNYQDIPKLSYLHANSNGGSKPALPYQPKSKLKTLVNNAFADVEFSDDEDDDIFITTDTGFPISSNMKNVNSSYLYKFNENNVPNRDPGNMKSGLPPLISVKSGACVKSVYADKNRPNTSNIIDLTKMNDFKNDTPVCFKRPNNDTRYRGQSSSFNHPRNSSILSQQYKTSDKNNYYNLLSMIMPQLYKPDQYMSSMQQESPIGRSSFINRSGRKTEPIVHNIRVNLDDEDKPNLTGNANDIIDLDDDDNDEKILSAYNKLEEEVCLYDIKKQREAKRNELPYVTPVNTFKERIDLTPVCKPDWLDSFQSKWTLQRNQSKKEISEVEEEVRQLSQESVKQERALNDRIREMQIIDPDIVVIDEFPEPIQEDEFREFTKKEEDTLTNAVYSGSPDQTLVSKFNMNISRRDISTLVGSNWLNDEVINFYMNLLTERGNLRSQEGLPKVYAMNTFFIPRLCQSGHRGVSRWTRKVDIFAHDILPIPVHVGGVHWCMAIINLKERTIKYYDSMGTPNPRVLHVLEQYLKEEHLDKKKQNFDTSDFQLISVPDCPRQMNGSDCGVFSCMIAECISRNKEITFAQEHMQYFRSKMILEIVTGKLMH